MINCEKTKEHIRSFSLVKECDAIQSGDLRIATPFNYPNGSAIDLFITRGDDLFKNYILSDFGQTSDYVSDMQFNLWATKKRRDIINDICESLNVTQSDGQFEIKLDDKGLTCLSDAIVRLAQVCIRVSDLLFTQRLVSSGTFTEEIEDFLSIKDLIYEPDVIVKGEFDNDVKIDFKVSGKSITSLIQTISTGTNSRVVSNEVFKRWFDIQSHRDSNQFITIYDQTYKNYHEDDIARLSKFSTVFGFPREQDQISEVINA